MGKGHQKGQRGAAVCKLKIVLIDLWRAIGLWSQIINTKMALGVEEKAKMMIKKSDAMLQHEKWTEETMKHRPKHSREGLPIKPIHGLFFLCAVLMLLVVIGSLLHH